MTRLADLGHRAVELVGGREMWRHGLRRWLPALAALIVAVALFSLYQSRFAGRAEVSAQALARGKRQLAQLRAERDRIEGELALVAANRNQLARFYGERLATERQRLTRTISEVKELARRCGLAPQAISYPDETIEGFRLRKRSFQFEVEGSYSDLRKLINLLELSDSFLTLERVSLTGDGDAGGGRLRIALTLSTLFATDAAAAESETATASGDNAPTAEATGGGEIDE